MSLSSAKRTLPNGLAYLKMNNGEGGLLSFLESSGCGRDWRELSLKRKLFCKALDKILSDYEVSRGGGDIPTTFNSSIFHLLFSLL